MDNHKGKQRGDHNNKAQLQESDTTQEHERKPANLEEGAAIDPSIRNCIPLQSVQYSTVESRTSGPKVETGLDREKLLD